MVPHLVTALNGPLLDLENKILTATPAIERWFRLEWQEHTPPFYCSVDLRNAGFKLAPVNTNLFPGGFNNLSPEMLPLAVQAAMAAIDKYCPDARNLLLIPEQDSNNTFYLQNIARLIQIFRQTGLNVRLGSLSPDLKTNTPLELPDGSVVMLEPLERSKNGRRIGLKNFDPCTVLLNNDLSIGVPTAALENLHEQTVLPPLHACWSVRRKSNHFAAYDEVVKKFSKLIDVDPWMLNPYYKHCGVVDFGDDAQREVLMASVDSLLARIRKKYKEYGIKAVPFVIIKSDASAYGTGTMTVRRSTELKDQLCAQQNLGVFGAGGPVSDIIIQEGVHSFERINDAVAEPVVYLIDRYVVGGFYRVHADGSATVDHIDNRKPSLNAPEAPGAHYVPLAFAQQHTVPDLLAKAGTTAPNRFYMYGVVARLAAVAASLEMERTDPNPEVY